VAYEEFTGDDHERDRKGLGPELGNGPADHDRPADMVPPEYYRQARRDVSSRESRRIAASPLLAGGGEATAGEKRHREAWIPVVNGTCQAVTLSGVAEVLSWYGIDKGRMIGRARATAGTLRTIPLLCGPKQARIVLLDDIIASWKLYGQTPHRSPWEHLRIQRGRG